MRTRLRVLGVATATAVAAVAVPLVTSSEAHAARFTGGDVVVYRVGDGRVRSVERRRPGLPRRVRPTGTKIQSVALPTTAAEGNHRLTASGQSRSEGLIDRSADGRFIAVTGYDAAVGDDRRRRAVADHHRPDPTPPGPRPGGRQRHGRHHHRAARRRHGQDHPLGHHDHTVSASGPPAATAASSPPRVVARQHRGRDAASNLSALTVQGGQLFSSGILTDRLAKVGAILNRNQ